MAQQLGSLEKVLRFGEGRRVKRLAEQASYIGTLEPEFEALSDAELAGKTAEFRQRIENGEPVDELVFEAFAAVREAFKRTMGIRLFDVQEMGGIVLHEGDIAEMKTGEGKTFVAVQPLYLNALTGNSVHLVTVNDYLAKRDPEWTKPVWEALGMRASFIQNLMPFDERREAYAADVIYGTNSEFGFDYLRDNMAVTLDGLVQRGHEVLVEVGAGDGSAFHDAAYTAVGARIVSLDEVWDGGAEADCPALVDALALPDGTSGGPHWGALDNFERTSGGRWQETAVEQRMAVSNYFVARSAVDGNHKVGMVDIAKDGQLSLDDTFLDENHGTPCVDFNRDTWPHGDNGDAKPHSQLFVVTNSLLD